MPASAPNTRSGAIAAPAVEGIPWRLGTPLGRGRAVLLARRHAVVLGLVALVGASALLRWLASLAHVVPYYFADEYIYASLARGISEHGAPVVRGSSVAFPAILEPLQTSPFYAFFGLEDAFRLTQGLHAVEMSLAAVPVFLLARRLGLERPLALACSAVAVTSPALFWSAFVLAEPLSYPLALTTIYAAVCVLDEPRPKTQLFFLATAGLATAARTQYVVFFLALPLAALAVERGRLARVARTQWFTVGLLALAVVAMLGAALVGALGPYTAWFGVATEPGVVGRSVALDALVLALAAGAVVVPGAIVGLDLLLSQPRTRAERGFAAFCLFVGAAIAGLAALGAATRVQERYLIVMTPVPALLCAIWIQRGMPRRHAATVLALALGAAYIAVELTAWDATHSPTLRALSQFEEALGAVGIRAAAAALVLAAVPLMFLRRGSALLVAAIIATGALSVGAAVSDRANAQAVREGRLPAQKDWLDRSGLGDVSLIHPPGAQRAPALQQLFWNRSLGRVLELPGADPLDFFATASTRITADGRLLVDERPVRSPLVVPSQGAAFTFWGARTLRRIRDFELVEPTGDVHIATMISGRYRDGWAGDHVSIGAWPAASGSQPTRLAFVLSLPGTRPEPAHVRVRLHGRTRSLIVRPGERVPVFVATGATRPVRVALTASPVFELGNRSVAVQVSRPRLLSQRP